MIPGEIRRHFLEQGEIAAFYGLKPKETAKELNLNIKGLKGFPEMYFDECNNFPNCQYDINSLEGKINPDATLLRRKKPSWVIVTRTFYRKKIRSYRERSDFAYLIS